MNGKRQEIIQITFHQGLMNRSDEYRWKATKHSGLTLRDVSEQQTGLRRKEGNKMSKELETKYYYHMKQASLNLRKRNGALTPESIYYYDSMAKSHLATCEAIKISIRSFK